MNAHVIVLLNLFTHLSRMEFPTVINWTSPSYVLRVVK